MTGLDHEAFAAQVGAFAAVRIGGLQRLQLDAVVVEGRRLADLGQTL